MCMILKSSQIHVNGTKEINYNSNSRNIFCYIPVLFN